MYIYVIIDNSDDSIKEVIHYSESDQEALVTDVFCEQHDVDINDFDDEYRIETFVGIDLKNAL